MKAAVVFYSYDGNCKFIARQIGKLLNADIIEIQTVNKKRRRGFLKIMVGGAQVVLGKKPAIEPVDFNPEAFDLIIFGSPVWAGSPAPAMKVFLSQTKITGKNAALFMCHGGGKGKAFNKFKNFMEGNTIVSEIDFKNPVKDPEAAIQKIEEWVKTLT